VKKVYKLPSPRKNLVSGQLNHLTSSTTRRLQSNIIQSNTSKSLL
jgi:hypothetical protein